jgi:hypothetical protein
MSNELLIIGTHEVGRKMDKPRNNLSDLPPFGSAAWQRRTAAEVAGHPVARLDRRPLTTDEINALGAKIRERQSPKRRD